MLILLQHVAQDLNCTVEWGQLGFRDTWRRVPSSILQRLLLGWRAPLAPGAGSAAADAAAAAQQRWRRGLLSRLDDSVDEEDFAAVAASAAAADEGLISPVAATAEANTAQLASITDVTAAECRVLPAERDLLAADAIEAAVPGLREAEAVIQEAAAAAPTNDAVPLLDQEQHSSPSHAHTARADLQFGESGKSDGSGSGSSKSTAQPGVDQHPHEPLRRGGRSGHTSSVEHSSSTNHLHVVQHLWAPAAADAACTVLHVQRHSQFSASSNRRW